MKIFKKTIEDNIKKDNLLEAKYLAREMYLITDFFNNISKISKKFLNLISYKGGITSMEEQKILKLNLKNLFELWNSCEISYKNRLQFLENLELM